MENIFLAILFSSCIIVTFRLFKVYNINNIQAITVNYAIAALLSFLTHGEPVLMATIPAKPWFIWSLINGLLFILVFLVFAYSAQKAGVAITSVASKMSVIIPVSIGIFLYKDSMNLVKLAGIITAFPAFYLVFYGKGKENGKNSRQIILPLLLFMGTGMNDSIMKHARMYSVGDEYLLFLGTIFAISFIIGVIVLAGSYKQNLRKITLSNIAGGLLLGLFNYLSTMFFLKSLVIFESTVFFPIFNVSIVSMGALIGYFIFREKLKAVNWAGIALAIATILLIAIA